ncbi:MAG: hypothetical protein HY904_06680 [Deltaproteobacteria bacterium]|nr:hypothetical protein [Deltaproteobacteria bacterium]
MKISRVHIRPVQMTLRRPFVTSAGVQHTRDGWLLFIELGGVVGVGECTPLAAAGTEDVEHARRALERAQGLLPNAQVDNVRDVDRVASHVTLEGAPCARFAVETALLDALARLQGVPVAFLLGRSFRRRVELNAVVAGDVDPAPEIARLRREGFRAFKLKVGIGSADTRRVFSARDAAGGDAVLRVDANGACDGATAARMLGSMEPARLAYCEDPVASSAEAVGLRTQTRVPIAADMWMSAARQHVLGGGVADVVVLKPAVQGGVLPSMRIAAVAAEHGMDCVVTSTLDGVVARLAALHLACALPGDLPAGLATGSHFDGEYAADPAAPVDGGAELPAASGLGFQEDAFA